MFLITASPTPALQRTLRCLAVAGAAAATLAMQPASAQPTDLSDSVNAVELAENLRLTVFGLTDDQRLVRLRVATPQLPRMVGTISGLNGNDTSLVGIDFRVQGTAGRNLAPGLLYGVGNAGGIYTIDTASAVATLISQLTVPLSGTSFGVDFNPAANALRIVSDAGQNLSHTIDNNTTAAQTALSFPGRNAFAVTGAAYVNNDLDPSTATTLFDIDHVNNVVAIQSPPAGGVLVTAGALTVDPDAQIGFDIYSKLAGGVAVRNSGFASMMVGGKTGLYRVNLLTGKASLVGRPNLPLVDIALPLDQ